MSCSGRPTADDEGAYSLSSSGSRFFCRYWTNPRMDVRGFLMSWAIPATSSPRAPAVGPHDLLLQLPGLADVLEDCHGADDLAASVP